MHCASATSEDVELALDELAFDADDAATDDTDEVVEALAVVAEDLEEETETFDVVVEILAELVDEVLTELEVFAEVARRTSFPIRSAPQR